MANNPHEVRGYQINCLNYVQCPICYGCRNYSGIDPECKICAQNKKNVCDTRKHRADLISRMITHTKIDLHNINNEDIKFGNKS